MGDPRADELRARGIDHPRAEDDADLIEAVDILLELGASLDELAEKGFARAASAHSIRPHPWHGDAFNAALDSIGVDEEFSTKLRIAMGLAGGSGLGLTAAELDATRFFASLRDVVGEAETLSIVRVLGSSTARIARATASLLRVNFQPPIDNSTAPLSDALRAYAALIETSLPPFLDATATLVQRHLAGIIAEEKDWRVDESHSAELVDQVIGFADLIGFTAFTEQADAEQFMAAMARFESQVQDAVVGSGGTVVKLIGDEVMFVTADAHEAVEVAVALLSVGRDIAGLEGMRVGLSGGQVISSGGDYYGTVVNIAARIVAQAFTEAIVGTAQVVHMLGLQADATSLGEHALRGISQPVELFHIKST